VVNVGNNGNVPDAFHEYFIVCAQSAGAKVGKKP
jgi:hypothetical protein